MLRSLNEQREDISIIEVHTGTFDDLQFFLVYFDLALLFEKLKDWVQIQTKVEQLLA